MSDPLDLTGVWYGRYFNQYEENSFIATLEEAGGIVGGAISEPDDDDGGIRRATVSGKRTGQALFFVKQYNSGRWHHAVHYSGRIDAEGVVIAGSWKLGVMIGTFEMQREKFTVEELEAGEEAELILGPSGR